jgi:ubiquinone/menaquinone biosynthesis C-methylase UbiE
MWQKYINGQYRRPTGSIGRWIGSKMARQHQPENAWTVNLLDVQSTDQVLEIGFGPGIAVEAVAARATKGLVAGIDFSQAMVSAANRRNAAAVRAGKVDLRYGDAAHLPFANDTFDKAFSIHSIYFWPDPIAVLTGIHRVLKPDGLLMLTVLPKVKWNPENPDLTGTPECKPYSDDELKTLLAQTGFTNLHIESDPNTAAPSNYSVIGRKPAF